jgi:hypothetical protein
MPRYYFHLVRDDERIPDDDGAELNPEDLRPDLLLRLLQTIRTGEDPSLVEEWHGWSVEITDEAGRVVQVIVI